MLDWSQFATSCASRRDGTCRPWSFTEVFVSKVGDKVVLLAKPSSRDDFFDAKPEGAQGFLGRRNDRPPQKQP